MLLSLSGRRLLVALRQSLSATLQPSALWTLEPLDLHSRPAPPELRLQQVEIIVMVQ